jgi:hypothetical protein
MFFKKVTGEKTSRVMISAPQHSNSYLFHRPVGKRPLWTSLASCLSFKQVLPTKSGYFSEDFLTSEITESLRELKRLHRPSKPFTKQSGKTTYGFQFDFGEDYETLGTAFKSFNIN